MTELYINFYNFYNIYTDSADLYPSADVRVECVSVPERGSAGLRVGPPPALCSPRTWPSSFCLYGWSTPPWAPLRCCSPSGPGTTPDSYRTASMWSSASWASHPSCPRDANGAVQVGRDVVPMALMAAASLVLLAYLLRHSRRARGLRGDGARQGPTAERRAALTVVTLVSLYLLFYGVDNGLWVYTLTVPQTLGSSLISDLRIFFSSLYAAVSPIVIIISNKKVNKQLNCGKEPKTISDAAQPSTDGQSQTKRQTWWTSFDYVGHI